ncbi:MAG: TonB-dependent receptor [Candidatus Aminicenantes bacterium]|nr:TonB-dependent receptor [Candidatus Aminicenantes bacterium]
MKRLTCFLLLSLFFLIPYFYSFSPETILKGRVFDENGNPLRGVTVEIFNSEKKTTTNSEGEFVIKGLESGSYRLLFMHTDFMPGVLEVTVKPEENDIIKVDLYKRTPKLITIKEEITVTAESDSTIDVSLPSHRTILNDQALYHLGTSNITESVENSPGVTAVGKGGYSMVPAIRGLAEHRILLLMDGIRIRSERRIGASASFINVNNIERLEVNRGPYSVYYGSGAIGGILNIITKSPESTDSLSGNIDLSYNTIREERSASFNLSGTLNNFGYLFSANGKKANDYSSPDGVIKWSRYSDYDLMLKLNRSGKDSQVEILLFNYQGTNIGKPSPSSEFKPRWYPNERNTVFSIGYEAKNKLFLNSLNARFYIFSSLLETQKEDLRQDRSVFKRNSAQIETLNFGFKIRGSRDIGKRHTFNLGADYFGRGNINDSNTAWLLDELGQVSAQTKETSLLNASRHNFGFYVDDKFHLSNQITLNAGARFDHITTSNGLIKGGRVFRNDQSFTAYIGSIFQLNPYLSLLANAGRSFRFPTISELFYTGLTGRGTVFGNPDLDPEKSLNLDVGLRYLQGNFFGSVYLFRNSIFDMIHKYQSGDIDEYYYENLNKGYITGVEGEFYFWLMKDFEIFTNFHHMAGKQTSDNTPMNYIPPFRITLSTKFSPGNFWIEPKLTLSAPKKNPGPLEIEINGFTLLDCMVGYSFKNHFKIVLITKNLLNQTFRASADEKGVYAPARTFILRASYLF